MLENTRHLEQGVICWVRTPQVVFGLLSGAWYKPQKFSGYHVSIQSFSFFFQPVPQRLSLSLLLVLVWSDLWVSSFLLSWEEVSIYLTWSSSYDNSAFFLKLCFSLFLCVITFKFYSFSKSQLCSVVLSTIVASFTLDPQILFILQQKIQLWISHSLAWYWDTGCCPCFPWSWPRVTHDKEH